MNTYVIGDVHGHYNTLMKLVAKLPSDAKLIFVGDLIDRGPKSVEVVKFVREGGHVCVLGNHEEMMMKEASTVMHAYKKDRELDFFSLWFRHGGRETLFSYNIIQLKDNRLCKVDNPDAAIARLEADLEWMKNLPLYVEVAAPHASGKKVIVSHACVASVWHLHDDEKRKNTFAEYALWNRKNPPPKTEMPIFNIFGHTPVEFGVEIEEHYVNVDTGCYSGAYGYGELSAYCVETGEVVKVSRVL